MILRSIDQSKKLLVLKLNDSCYLLSACLTETVFDKEIRTDYYINYNFCNKIFKSLLECLNFISEEFPLAKVSDLLYQDDSREQQLLKEVYED